LPSPVGDDPWCAGRRRGGAFLGGWLLGGIGVSLALDVGEDGRLAGWRPPGRHRPVGRWSGAPPTGD